MESQKSRFETIQIDGFYIAYQNKDYHLQSTQFLKFTCKGELEKSTLAIWARKFIFWPILFQKIHLAEKVTFLVDLLLEILFLDMKKPKI